MATTTKKKATKPKVKSATKKTAGKKTTARKSTAKSTKKKTGTKAKKAAPKKKRVITSPKVRANNKNFAARVSLATDHIYEAGQKGRSKPSWGQALRAVS